MGRWVMSQTGQQNMDQSAVMVSNVTHWPINQWLSRSSLNSISNNFGY